MELKEETIKELDERNAKIDKAARNICQCLDGFMIYESEYVLDRVKSLLRKMVISPANIRGIDDKR